MTKSDDDDLIADVIDRGRKGRPIAWAWVGDLSRSHRPGGHVWRFSVSTAASWSRRTLLCSKCSSRNTWTPSSRPSHGDSIPNEDASRRDRFHRWRAWRLAALSRSLRAS